jgi:hypothetical protein
MKWISTFDYLSKLGDGPARRAFQWPSSVARARRDKRKPKHRQWQQCEIIARSNQISVGRPRLGEFSPELSPSRLHISLLFDISSCAASFHCKPSISSILRNTGSSVCSAAREYAVAWSSQT